MIINKKQLKKVAVETQSGISLGYVTDFEVETDTGTIEKYMVRSRIWENALLISKAQIISFDQDKMIVEDAVVKAQPGIAAKFVEATKLEGAEPVITEKI